jgi:copper transport protein
MPIGSLIADAGGAAAIAARALALATAIGMMGATLFRFVVIPTGMGAVGDAVTRRTADVGFAAALLGIVAAGVRLVLQAEAFASPGDALLPLVATVIRTTWGRADVVVMAASAVAAWGFGGARRGRPGRWWQAAVGGLVASIAPSFMGHAAAQENAGPLAVAADAVHVIAAGGWAGGVLMLALAARRLGAEPAGGAAMGELIARFRRPALTCAGALLATGVVAALFRLRAPADLVGSTYGNLLIAKLALVAAAAALGRRHSQTAASSATADGAHAVGRSIALEAVLFAFVTLVTAVLAGSPPPGEG